jgi:hypothetical protein
MPSFIENTLEAGAYFLQTSLQCPWTHVKVARHILYIRSMSRQSLLDRSPGQVDEAILSVMLLELLLELWCKHVQQFCIPRDEGIRSIARAENHDVARFPADNGAAEVPFEGPLVRSRLHQFHSHRRDPRSTAMTSNREYPGEAMLDEYRWLDIHSQRQLNWMLHSSSSVW